MRPSGAELEELREKYARMLQMRVEHASGEEDLGRVRARMAELAARFPGALRELDDLELDEIRRRLSAIDLALRGAEPERWMAVMTRFHALTRGALCAKRWLAGRKQVGPALRATFLEELGRLAYPEDARAWAEDLARIASPPRGRVTDLVVERIADELDETEHAVRHLVFGAPRRLRRRGPAPPSAG